MKITKIEQQKRKPLRCNLYLDNVFFIGINANLITDLDLYQGKEISPTEKAEIEGKEDYGQCLAKAYTYLSIRQQSEKELRTKLYKKYSLKSINLVINRLKELNYIDDLKFAKAWIEQRQSNRGPKMLKLELINKGIAKETIEKMLGTEVRNKDNELENALNLVEKKKWSQNMTKDEQYTKIGGYLARRGFDYEIIKRVIKEFEEK